MVMKKYKIILLIIGYTTPYIIFAQNISGEYTTELQYNLKKNFNCVNLLRLYLSIPTKNGLLFSFASIHTFKINKHISNDYQTFSNVEEENCLGAISLLGCTKINKLYNLFIGIRNVNEDFFTSESTSLFTNSSCGIFPTISASYPIANYPLSGLTLFFEGNFGKLHFKNSVYNGKGYNGYTHNNNPFIIAPKQDGIFNITEINYNYRNSSYFGGIALHTCTPNTNIILNGTTQKYKKISAAWWLYTEQYICKYKNGDLKLMAQYSENTNKNAGCNRYSEIGLTYNKKDFMTGISLQHANFIQGNEFSSEITYRQKVNNSITIQSSLHYIKNNYSTYFIPTIRMSYNIKH